MQKYFKDRRKGGLSMAELKLTVSNDLQSQLEMLMANTAREVLKEVKQKELTTKPYMNYKEACEYVGIARNTLTSWRNEYGLKTISVAGKTLISKETLDQFLKDYEK